MSKSNRVKYSIINMITGFGGHILSIFLKFIGRTVFIYTLGKAYLGIEGLFANILSMLSLAELGVGSAIAFRLYKPLAEKDEKSVRVLLKFYKLAYKVIGSIILILGLLLIPFLPKLIKDYDSLEKLGINAVLLFLLYLAKSVTSYLFLAYRSTVVTADQKKYILDIVNYSVKIVTSIIQIIVLIVLRSFIAFCVVGVMSSIVNSLINGMIAKKIYPQYFVSEEDSLSKKELKEMLQDCGALFIFKINGVVLKATDNLVLSAFIGIATVGMYSNYLLLYRTSVDLISKMFSAFRASMGNLFATATMKTKYQFFRTVNFMTALMFGTAAVGVAVCANEVIDVWIGADYILEQPIPILIGIEIFFYGILVNLGQVRSISGIFRQAWFRPLLGIVVNVAVSVVFVDVLGIAGVILGTIASYVTTNFMIEPALIYKYTFKNFKPVSEYYKDNLKYIIVCLVIAIIDMWLCSHVLCGYGIISMVFHVFVVGISVPMAFVVLFWKTKECQYLVSLVKRTIRKMKLMISNKCI